ncbi:hypothetical protein K0M31_015235 [Melipona bicolor]|uniref:Uncharacterized protein n=1 Tax=Melipona bicolor TaxID=60889 RepID=A0AA40KF79_9HYME|nr:hypothetical protein K0M31_015235 [Melipona bicolor]
MLPLRVFVQSTGIRVIESEGNRPADGAGTMFFLPAFFILCSIQWSIQCTYLDAAVTLTVFAPVQAEIGRESPRKKRNYTDSLCPLTTRSDSQWFPVFLETLQTNCRYTIGSENSFLKPGLCLWNHSNVSTPVNFYSQIVQREPPAEIWLKKHAKID